MDAFEKLRVDHFLHLIHTGHAILGDGIRLLQWTRLHLYQVLAVVAVYGNAEGGMRNGLQRAHVRSTFGKYTKGQIVPFEHPLVRELAWCIGSRPLMLDHPKNNVYRTLDTDWFDGHFAQAENWLAHLDAHPDALEQFMADHPTRLLGKRFERLVEFWLRESGDFSLSVSGQPLFREGRTVGEIDFIAEELATGKLLHLEVACKFYLGYNNSPRWSDWRGPNATDTLKLKMDKLVDQLSVLDGPVGQAFLQEKRMKRPEACLMLKGYLFHHFRTIAQHRAPTASIKDYPTGFWLWLRESEAFFRNEGHWMLLPKSGWLAPVRVPSSEAEVYESREMRQVVAQAVHQYKRGIMIVRLGPSGEMLEEWMRGMVVPNAWPGK